MPIYEYRCLNDHRFEVLQKFSDEPVDVCQVCGASAQRVLHPVAIHFKGSGFYSTDYGRGKKAAASPDGKSDSTDAKPSADTPKPKAGDSATGAKAAEG
jgi:putative FmdB family regulatory protein